MNALERRIERLEAQYAPSPGPHRHRVLRLMKLGPGAMPDESALADYEAQRPLCRCDRPEHMETAFIDAGELVEYPVAWGEKPEGWNA